MTTFPHNVEMIPSFDLAPLDELLLDEAGRLRPLPAARLWAIPLAQLRGWCVKRARYQLLTIELIDWLRRKIDGREAIEVGAGMGDLGRQLGIPMTDSCCQELPVMRLYYRSIGQAITEPPGEVLRLNAVEAIERFRLIAGWMTQGYEPGDEGHGTSPPIGSSVYGPDERWIIQSCHTYIHIGNLNTHGDKRPLSIPHETFSAPWLVSRAADQSRNVIYIWHGGANR